MSPESHDWSPNTDSYMDRVDKAGGIEAYKAQAEAAREMAKISKEQWKGMSTMFSKLAGMAQRGEMLLLSKGVERLENAIVGLGEKFTGSSFDYLMTWIDDFGGLLEKVNTDLTVKYPGGSATLSPFVGVIQLIGDVKGLVDYINDFVANTDFDTLPANAQAQLDYLAGANQAYITGGLIGYLIYVLTTPAPDGSAAPDPSSIPPNIQEGFI